MEEVVSSFSLLTALGEQEHSHQLIMLPQKWAFSVLPIIKYSAFPDTSLAFLHLNDFVTLGTTNSGSLNSKSSQDHHECNSLGMKELLLQNPWVTVMYPLLHSSESGGYFGLQQILYLDSTRDKKVLTYVESNWSSGCLLFCISSVLDSNRSFNMDCKNVPKAGLCWRSPWYISCYFKVSVGRADSKHNRGLKIGDRAPNTWLGFWTNF